jgi:hypothetical protein
MAVFVNPDDSMSREVTDIESLFDDTMPDYRPSDPDDLSIADMLDGLTSDSKSTKAGPDMDTDDASASSVTAPESAPLASMPVVPRRAVKSENAGSSVAAPSGESSGATEVSAPSPSVSAAPSAAIRPTPRPRPTPNPQPIPVRPVSRTPQSQSGS